MDIIFPGLIWISIWKDVDIPSCQKWHGYPSCGKWHRYPPLNDATSTPALASVHRLPQICHRSCSRAVFCREPPSSPIDRLTNDHGQMETTAAPACTVLKCSLLEKQLQTDAVLKWIRVTPLCRGSKFQQQGRVNQQCHLLNRNLLPLKICQNGRLTTWD